jgi:amino acid adenylation domain-containing protein
MIEELKTYEPKKNKSELIEQLLKNRGIAVPSKSEIQRRSNQGELNLSSAQQRIWFLQQYEPESTSYNIPIAVRLKGKLDIQVLEKCLNELVRRHDILRASFISVNGAPAQVINEAAKVKLTVKQLSASEKHMLQGICKKHMNISFDLSVAPLMAATLLLTDDDDYILLLCIHHIIADGWSTGIMVQEIAGMYSQYLLGKEPEMEALPVQYTDYVYWQHQQESTSDLEYWKNKLTGATLILDIPKEHAKAAIQSSRGAFEGFELNKDRTLRLKELARNNGVTLYILLLAVYYVQLYRYTGQEDIVIGTPVAGRSRLVLEKLIGLFVNSLALRTDLGGRTVFTELLGRVKATVFEAYAHQELPFEKIVEALKPERSSSHTPIFQTMFTLQNSPLKVLELSDLVMEIMDIDSGISQFDLSVTLREENEVIKGFFEYNTDLFENETVRRMVSHYTTLVDSILNNPDAKISDIPIMTDDELSKVLIEWNQTEEEYPEKKCIAQLFEEQAALTPDNTAVIFEGKQLTYRQLDERASAITEKLVRAGVAAGTCVGIYADYSLELIIGIMGVLKTGAAYVPLDPEYPSERLEFMLKDSNTRFLLMQRYLESSLPHTVENVIYLEDTIFENSVNSGDYKVQYNPSNLACIIYTSGSTGIPKGVMLENKGIVNLINSFIKCYKAGPADRVLPLTSIGSASFAGEILPIICAGGSIVLAKKTDVLDIEKLMILIEKYSVSIISTVPSLIAKLNARETQLPRLRLLLSGGEALSVGDLEYLLKTTSIANGYGLTETTICSTYQIITEREINEKSAVTIGRPLMNTKLYILDKNLNLMPVGCPGEIYISGVGLARGYLNNSRLTDEKFVPNPYLPGRKMFKTGDIGCWLEDGTIKYVGRLDSQVKLRGFRIELGEIKAILEQHRDILEAAVIVREDIPNQKKLTAYIVLNRSGFMSDADLRRWLGERLPGYMVPSEYVIINSMPYNTNGKIDIKALPISAESKTGEYDEEQIPRTAAQKAIAEVWKEFLHVDAVRIDDNFFDLGGHSLLIMQVHEKLNHMFDKKLTVVDMFKYPTVRLLAEFLGDKQQEAVSQQKLQDRVSMQKEMLSHRRNLQLQSERNALDAVAIIGMAGRFPKARNINEFWKNICEGNECISFYTDEEMEASGISKEYYRNPKYIKAKGELEDIELFDAAFFDFSPREAEIMDPQHRLLLECAWEAMEDAGYDSERVDGRVGVFAGASMGTYLLLNILPGIESLVASTASLQAAIGNDKDSLTTTISYRMNLRGPGISIQSSSSTSLVAVGVACQSLLNYQCDMALAGGVSLGSPKKNGYMYEEGGIVAPDGHCRPFDSEAKGFVPGTGLGLVMLKRLSEAERDGDHIYAVIKGFAVNNDGSKKVSYSAPSVDAQAEVIAEAQALAGLNPETITYIEAHGTGTALGDPIEIAALTQAFRMGTDKKNYCAVGSVKSNIGHLDTAAGVTGLIKTALCVKHGLIPPTLHFKKPNPKINFAESPFYVNTELKEWKSEGTLRRAGVTSLGMGGTNAHVVLEEASGTRKSGSSREWQMLMLSAKTDTALNAAVHNLKKHIANNTGINLADVAYTLQVGRKEMNKRKVILCRNTEEAVTLMETNDLRRVISKGNTFARPVVFMFTGQGAQYVNMAANLYEKEKCFRDNMDLCCNILKQHLDLDLREILYPPEKDKKKSSELLQQTWITQPALFAIEHSLAKQWMDWGVVPAAMIGHSIGEYTAACLAGVMKLEDALALVSARGRLMQSLPGGSMLAVGMSEKDAAALLNNEISMAAVNGPEFCVLSGTDAAIDKLQESMRDKGVYCSRLKTSHAFHSQMMQPILEDYEKLVRSIKLSAPEIPYISNATGEWIDAAEATAPGYWAKHLRQAVLFSDGINTLMKKDAYIFLEIGPGRTLSNFVKQHLEGNNRERVLTTLCNHDDNTPDMEHLFSCFGQLWACGVKINWESFYKDEVRNRLPLPSYPFAGKYFWITPKRNTSQCEYVRKEDTYEEDLGEIATAIHETERQYYDRPQLSSKYTPAVTETGKKVIGVWEELLGVKPIGIHDNFFELGGNSLMATQLISRIQNMMNLNVTFKSFFEDPTASNIAKYIDNAMAESLQEEMELEQLLNEVEGLSDEDLAELGLGDTAAAHEGEME